MTSAGLALGAPGDVGDAGLGESPLADDLGRGPQHLLTTQVRGAVAGVASLVMNRP